MNLIIEHQTQLLNNSCVSACLAMVLGEPQQKIIDEFHSDYVAGEIHPSEYLIERGISLQPYTFGVDYPVDPNKLWVYFLTVPSLNVMGGLHQVLLIWRGGDDRVYELYDPAKGFTTKKGKKGRQQRRFYTVGPSGGVALPLKNYVVDFVVDAQEFIYYRRNKAQ